MELHEFEVGEAGADPRRHGDTSTGHTLRVGGVAVEPSQATGCQHHAGGADLRPVAIGRGRHHAHHAPVDTHQVDGLPPLPHLDLVRSRSGIRQGALHLAPGGVTVGVNDPATTVPCLTPQLEIPVRGGVEVRPQLDEPVDGRLPTRRQDLDCPPHRQPARNLERVLGVEPGVVIRPHRRSDTALSPTRRPQRPRGQHRRLRQAQRHGEPRHTGTDDKGVVEADHAASLEDRPVERRT